jgi:hypothetical protein
MSCFLHPGLRQFSLSRRATRVRFAYPGYRSGPFSTVRCVVARIRPQAASGFAPPWTVAAGACAMLVLPRLEVCAPLTRVDVASIATREDTS